MDYHFKTREQNYKEMEIFILMKIIFKSWDNILGLALESGDNSSCYDMQNLYRYLDKIFDINSTLNAFESSKQD